MFKEFIDTGNALKEVGVTTNINQRVKYTANVVSNVMTAATIYQMIVGASNGTLVKQMIFKSEVSTIKGGIFLYLSPDGGGTLRFIDQIFVGNRISSGTQDSFEVAYDLDFYLASGWSLYAYFNTVQNIAVTTIGLNMSY